MKFKEDVDAYGFDSERPLDEIISQFCESKGPKNFGPIVGYITTCRRAGLIDPMMCLESLLRLCNCDHSEFWEFYEGIVAHVYYVIRECGLSDDAYIPRILKLCVDASQHSLTFFDKRQERLNLELLHLVSGLATLEREWKSDENTHILIRVMDQVTSQLLPIAASTDPIVSFLLRDYLDEIEFVIAKMKEMRANLADNTITHGGVV
jgi:hypothetical protein